MPRGSSRSSLALRDQVTKDGSLLWKLPDLLELAGNLVTTNLPVDRLPTLAAIADEIGDDADRPRGHPPSAREVRSPPSTGRRSIPNVKAIQAVAHELFPAPGEAPAAVADAQGIDAKPKATASP